MNVRAVVTLTGVVVGLYRSSCCCVGRRRSVAASRTRGHGRRAGAETWSKLPDRALSEVR